MGHFALHLLNEVFLGLVSGEAGDLFQHSRLALLDGADLLLFLLHGCVLLGQRFFLLLNGLQLAVQIFFLLLHELVCRCTAERTCCRSRFAFVYITANRTYKLFHE